MAAAAATLVLSGCHTDDRTSAGLTVETTDSAGVRVATIDGSPDVLPHWRLGAPQLVISGHEPPQFGRLGDAISLPEGGVAVVDRMADQVHLFADDGQLVRTLGRSGDAPGEFENIWGVGVAGDTVWVHDLAHDRVTIFGPDGSVARTFALAARLDEEIYERVYAVTPLEGGRYLTNRATNELNVREEVTPDARFYVSRNSLRVHDPAGRVVSGPIEYPGGGSVEVQTSRGRADAPAFFTGRPLLDVASGRAVYGNGAELDLTVVDSTLTPVRVIRWPGFTGPLDTDEVEALREDQLALFAEAGMLEFGRTVLEGALHPAVLPERRPALSEVLIDENGRIWAGRFDPLESPREWVVLDADGTPVGRVLIPANSRLTDVAADRVLLVTTDSLDVERLAAYPHPDRGRSGIAPTEVLSPGG